MQNVMNNGAMMHTAMGPIQMGLNSIAKNKWDIMLKLPMVKKAMHGDNPRLKECEAVKAKAQPKEQPKPEAKQAKGK